MDNDYSTAYGSGAVALFLALYIGFILVILVGSYLLMALSLSSFFKKVGVESWIAWVPIYNNWKWLEVGGQSGWLALIALIPYGGIVTSIFLYIGMYRTGKAFGKDGAFLVLGIFFPFIWAFILGGKNGGEYHPDWFAHFGWPPPLAGYGAVPADQRQPGGYQPQYQQPAGTEQFGAQPYGQQPYPGQQPPAGPQA